MSNIDVERIDAGLDEDPQFDDDGDTSAPVEIPAADRVLRTQAYDKAVSDLVGMIESGDIVLDPDYQRNYVWDAKRASLLVESFLLNVPIPIIYVSEEDDGKWSVVDGLQRLASLSRFFNDEFKLAGLEVLQVLNGYTFSKIPPREQRLLKNGILRIIVILQESNPEIKYDIFQRLNRGSIRLNEQELRNCLYRLPLTSVLRDQRANGSFLRVIGQRKVHKRFYDAELLLRCLAISDSFDEGAGIIRDYPNKMVSFLNAYMERSRSWRDGEAAAKIDGILRAIERVHRVFGDAAFRRYDPEAGTTDARLNRALMDAIVATFSRLDDDTVDRNRDLLKSLDRRLTTEDKEFSEALIYGTSDKKRLEYRVAAYHRFALKTIMEGA